MSTNWNCFKEAVELSPQEIMRWISPEKLQHHILLYWYEKYGYYLSKFLIISGMHWNMANAFRMSGKTIMECHFTFKCPAIWPMKKEVLTSYQWYDHLISFSITKDTSNIIKSGYVVILICLPTYKPFASLSEHCLEYKNNGKKY